MGAVTSVVRVPPPAGTAWIEVPVAPVPLTKAMFFPSGDQVGSNASKAVSEATVVDARDETSTTRMT